MHYCPCYAFLNLLYLINQADNHKDLMQIFSPFTSPQKGLKSTNNFIIQQFGIVATLIYINIEIKYVHFYISIIFQ